MNSPFPTYNKIDTLILVVILVGRGRWPSCSRNRGRGRFLMFGCDGKRQRPTEITTKSRDPEPEDKPVGMADARAFVCPEAGARIPDI